MNTDTAAQARDRWFGVGHSLASDAAAAGAEAAKSALAGRNASLLLVFSSISYDMTVLLDAIRQEAAEGTVIVGCSSMGQVLESAPAGDSVAVAALGGPGFQVYSKVARHASTKRREAGAEAAGCFGSIDRKHSVMIMLSDGLTGDQHEVVRGAYGVVGGAVQLVGGCAADELTYSRTYQFFGDGNGVEILTDAVIGVAIGSDAPLGVGLGHGWRKRGEAMVVTKSEGGVLYELDNEPALDVFLRGMGADRSLAEDPDAFRAAAFSHPLGMSRRSGEDIRAVHAGNLTDGSVVCLADVPQGAVTWLMETDEDALVAGAADSCSQAVAGLDEASPIGILVFDCGGRKIMLGRDGLILESAVIAKVAADVPFTGFYTFGEVARTHGSRGMHHLTVVSLAIA